MEDHAKYLGMSLLMFCICMAIYMRVLRNVPIVANTIEG